MEEKLIYLIAGEPSGDLLASRLMKALREKTDGKVRFAGVGGETMAEQGFESLFDSSELELFLAGQSGIAFFAHGDSAGALRRAASVGVEKGTRENVRTLY